MIGCKCGETNPDNFYESNKNKCKKCVSATSRERYHSLSTTEKEEYKDRSATWQDKNMITYRWKSAKSRAGKSGIEFSITERDIKDLLEQQKGLCYYTGLPMKIERDNNRYSVSLDRLDNNEGYVDGNVVLCCAAANIMKNDLGLEEFKELIEILYHNLDKF